jgi:two-component system sensor histidine kinase KdpD
VADKDRPSPDALLKQAARESRGRLKVLLGAAPGVGKTYEMLREGADRLKAGEDVVVGIVETHDRADTAALTAPFEIVPRRRIDHGGHVLDEMDLDALLARHPRIALVDELAHSNAPGSRHPKRWQDIEELRDAGIDVVTTVNIQHIESLNDVVASFTHVRVKETVPDHVLEDADIEVVDLPADDLIARLKAGKVYKAGEAERALGNFFGKTNLQALRELALRRAAQMVDRQMLDQVEAAGTPGAWAACERLLVAVSDVPGSDAVVRAGKRLADAMKAPWTAVVIETPRLEALDPVGRTRIAEALQLAVSLGGSIAAVPAASVAEGLISHATETRVTQLVVGKVRRSWWFELRHGSVVDRLVRDLEGVSVHVVPLARSEGASAKAAQPPVPGRHWAPAPALVALTVPIGLALQPWVGYGAIDLLFLIPVVLSASLLGLGGGLLATVCSALAYNFFFLPPIHTFTVTDPRNVITLFLLAAVAFVVSELAGRLRARASIGSRQARENAAIAAFGQRLATLSTEAETGRAIVEELSGLLGVNAVLLLREGPGLKIAAAAPADARLDTIDEASADWTLDRGVPAGAFTDTLAASEWQFHPLKTSLGVLAALGVANPAGGHPVPSDRHLLFTTLVGQSALAWERIRLEADARTVGELRSRDELRSTLLASIGHDLRTPLTAVVAAVDALRAEGVQSPRLDLLHRETRRLARFFADLIDMTRVEANAIAPRLEPVDLTDAAAAALSDMDADLAGHAVVQDVPADLPLVRTDARLLNHMLINLLSNAAAYTPAGSCIRLSAALEEDGLLLAVEDEGPGLPAGLAERLFDRFQRGDVSDRTGGTGLGLAIVKGFGDALGIVPAAANRRGGGSRFTLRFPPGLLVQPAAPAPAPSATGDRTA